MYRRRAADIEIVYCESFDLRTATSKCGFCLSSTVCLVDRKSPIDLMLVGIGWGTSPAHIDFRTIFLIFTDYEIYLLCLKISIYCQLLRSQCPSTPSISRYMKTVLVVDDSTAQREMIKELLQASGMTVNVATDGEQAVAVALEIVPDIVVLDVVMPKMNGYEVCRMLKSNPKTQDVPVILCSSKSEDFDKHWGMRQGADAYVCKPFEPVELLSTIKQLLRN
jgi:twitching motility two-component system response regulator PilH